MDYKSILSNFNIDGEVVSCDKYGEGHINDTYLAQFINGGKKEKYILQKINSRLFTNVDELMSNIELVTDFNREYVIKNGGDPKRECLSLVKTRDKKSYLNIDNTDYYRVYDFIDNAISYQVVEKPAHFYESAVAFGKFQNMLLGFDASKLYEILPGFHNTVKRFGDFKKSLSEDKKGRASGVEKEIEFALSREKYCGRIVELLSSGQMPLRVTHNDTKLNNVMIDAETEKGIAVIDLDTVMPGSVCYDFGDSIRFGCNPTSEDERDLSKVNFQTELFKVYAEGFLSVVKLTDTELKNLAFGSILMTYECGIRFLADYLDGDVYFRTSREGQNLDRARVQFKLVNDMEDRLNELNGIIEQISKSP